MEKLTDDIKQIAGNKFRVTTLERGSPKVHTVKFMSDNLMVKLGSSKMRIPRGFHVLEFPDGNYKISGFLPKFSNDERSDKFDFSMFDNINSVIVGLKLSGFLIGFTAISPTEVIFFSKNFADESKSIYIQKAREVIQPLLSDKLIEQLWLSKVTIWGELLSRDDKQHGYMTTKDKFFVTCISYDNGFQYPLCTYYKHDQIEQFCNKWGLEIAPFIKLSDAREKFQLLESNRDFMTWRKLKEIFPSYEIDHFGLVGDRVEGLVVFADNKTFKYKFPYYVMCTMGLRSMISGHFRFSVKEFCSRWCISSEGLEYFRKLLTFFQSLKLNDITVQNGEHIELFDRTIDEGEFLLVKLQEVTIIAVVGPIGSGKSTLGHKIAEAIDGVHIDGDKLPGFEKNTITLGQERNQATYSEVMKVVNNGKIPIISCGGGVLDNLFEQVQKCFNADLKLIKIGITGFSDEQTKAVLRKRIANDEWEVPKGQKLEQFLNLMVKRSNDNSKFWNCDFEYEAHSNPDELISKLPVQFGKVDDFKVRQYRAIVSLSVGKNNTKNMTKHITLGYYHNMINYNDLERIRLPGVIEGDFVTLHNGGSFVTLPCLDNKKHVTVNVPKNMKAVDFSDITEEYNAGTLVYKNSEKVVVRVLGYSVSY